MGNSSTSGFDLGERVECADNKHWAINLGSRKDGEKEPVTIMSFNKKQFADKLAPAQRCIQKSKTLKHPFVVAYVESAEYDDSLVLVTEQCKPLDAWLVEHAARAATDAAFSQELVWGFRCVLEALHFLHSNGLVHGYLGLHAVFVTKGGDMKVGALDLAANMTAEDDFAFLRTYAHLLGRPYLAPERADLARGNALKGGGKTAAGSEADIFALAHCIQAAFNKANLEVPPALAKYFSRMMSPDAVKRPTASQLLKVPVFNSDDIKLLVSLGELAGLKPANESLGTLKELSTKVDAIPTTICVHKILPSVARALQMACTDFANRDARELCRTSIQLSLDLLAQLAVRAKVDEDSFASKCLPAVLQLWSMTDRAVRTALLGSLKQLITLTPASAVNKSIFDQMLAGFADSNAKMREDTLKCLVHVIDKLDEKHLQEKLVRCIVNLQGDNEASIRTNATIFLGRIAGKLKDGVRLRVLGQAYLKALRDPFVHCRIAGLKATVACLAYVDHIQLTSKILPQACVLLLDRSQEVRELSLSLLDQSLVLMRSHHAVLCAAEKKAAEGGSANGNGAGPSSSSSGGGGNSNGTNDEAAGWGSWGSSLSKTLEKATGSMTSLASGAPAAVPPQTVATQQQQQSTSSTKHVDGSESSSLPQPAKTSSDSLPKVKDGWGDDWGDNDVDLDGGGDDDDDGSNVRNKNATSKSGWGDDDDLDLDDDGGGKASAAAAPVVPKGLAPSAAFKKKMEEKKPPAKKLDMDANDNWDDF